MTNHLIVWLLCLCSTLNDLSSNLDDPKGFYVQFMDLEIVNLEVIIVTCSSVRKIYLWGVANKTICITN